MNTAVTTLLDIDAEIPADSALVPKWFEQALAVPREEGWLESQGCPIHYFRWGDPSKPGLLLMHGFLAHARCFAFIAPFLAQDYHLVAYDFSGMGDSGVRETYPDELRLKELMDVAHHTGMFDDERKPTLIAHSYGGNVGLAAMENHDSLFSGLLSAI